MKASEFIHSLPERINTDTLEGHSTRFHFIFSGDDPADLTVEIEDSEVHVRDGLVGEPECVVKAKSDDFMKLLRGELNPMMALLTGKLKVSNQAIMMRYAKIFGWM